MHFQAFIKSPVSNTMPSNRLWNLTTISTNVVISIAHAPLQDKLWNSPLWTPVCKCPGIRTDVTVLCLCSGRISWNQNWVHCIWEMSNASPDAPRSLGYRECICTFNRAWREDSPTSFPTSHNWIVCNTIMSHLARRMPKFINFMRPLNAQDKENRHSYFCIPRPKTKFTQQIVYINGLKQCHLLIASMLPRDMTKVSSNFSSSNKFSCQ